MMERDGVEGKDGNESQYGVSQSPCLFETVVLKQYANVVLSRFEPSVIFS